MACSSLYNFGSPVAKELCERAKIRRSFSDNHLCYFVNGIFGSSTQPKLPKTNCSNRNGILNFHLSGEKEKETEERGNWVERLMEIRSHWRTDRKERDAGNEDCDEEEGCKVDYCNEDEEEEEEGNLSIDGESFSKVLVGVSWSEVKLFSQLAFLCNLAYVIPEIKAKDLRNFYGLDFITSSLEKKAAAAALKTKFDQDSIRVPLDSSSEKAGNSRRKRLISPSVAYGIASSAASYVHSRAKDLLSLVSEPPQQEGSNAVSTSTESHPMLDEEEGFPSRVCKSKVTAFVAAASTMTAVVAADEKEKEEAAINLQSFYSSPCEWFVCDDSTTYTRCFVIQGSESLASWQTNLFFEPSKFEGTEVLVHRGINEAAKGIYEQFIPEIMEHLNKYGNRAKLQFTGHSLGGSLSLLVNLMLLSRKVVKPSSLLPVVTFGSPFVFCGGQKILHELGLDENHVHCVMMHRDIVPRAFSCNFPKHVAAVLKRVNGSFRSHPCLNKNKLLYSPMGKIFILQPDEKSSPPHPLLPPGSGLYALETSQYGSTRTALRAFLNTPHPLETLSNPTAYGSDGTIIRDHDSNNYLKAVNGIIRDHKKMVLRKVRKQSRRMWPRLALQSPDAWSNEVSLEDSRLANEEVMTGI